MNKIKKTLGTLVLGLASAVGTSKADMLVHQSAHYQFFTEQKELNGFYLYAKNFTDNESYNPNTIASGGDWGSGISGRLHQQYVDFGNGEIVGTPTQREAGEIFKNPLLDSHWIYDRNNALAIIEPTENYGVWDSDVFPELVDSISELQPFAKSDFGNSMTILYKNMDICEREMPIAYIVTDDISSINCSMWVGGSVGADTIGNVDGVVSSASSFAYGDSVSFNLNPIPEPTTLATLVLGGTALLSKRKRNE